MTKTSPEPLPSAGGTYVRQPDGTLTATADIKPTPKPKAAKAADTQEG
jgi:hypothetical protein